MEHQPERLMTTQFSMIGNNYTWEGQWEHRRGKTKKQTKNLSGSGMKQMLPAEKFPVLRREYQVLSF